MDIFRITLEDAPKVIAQERAWARDNGMRCKVYDIPNGFGIEKRALGYCSWLEFVIDDKTDFEIKEMIGSV